VLEGNDDQLSGHVGHRVNVKGTLVPPHDRESGGARVPAASGATGSDQVKSGTQLLKISSIERLADSCKAR